MRRALAILQIPADMDEPVKRPNLSFHDSRSFHIRGRSVLALEARLFSTVNHSDIRGLLTAGVSRARMIVIRRELPRSRDVGQHRRRPVRHIAGARMLRTAASPPGPERSPGNRCVLDWHLLGEPLSDRPDKPGQLAGHRHRRDLVQLTPTHEPPELTV